MAVTNTELKEIIEEQGEERRKNNERVNYRLGSIESHLSKLNGAVERNARDIAVLPCDEHGSVLAGIRAVVDAQPTAREMGRLEAQMEAQPTAREMGKLEEWQKISRTNWDRTWEFVKLPLMALLGAGVALLLSGQLI